MNLSLWLNNREFQLNLLEKEKNDIEVTLGKRKHRVFVESLSAEEILLNIDGKVYNIIVDSKTNSYSVYVDGKCFTIEKKSPPQILGSKGKKQRKKDIKTSMPGKIVKVLAEEGDRVEEGQAVLILEAMKMQNEIKSPQQGRITQIKPCAGDSVEAGSLLFSVE